MRSLSYLIKDPSPTAIIVTIASPWVGGFAAYSVIYCLFALFKSTTAISLSMVDVDMLITVLTAVLTTCVVASLLRGLHGTNNAHTEIEAAAAEAADEVEGEEGIEEEGEEEGEGDEDSTDVSSKSETETETETETEGAASTGDSPEGVSLLPPDTDSDETDTGDQADDEADAAKDKDCFSATPTEM